MKIVLILFIVIGCSPKPTPSSMGTEYSNYSKICLGGYEYWKGYYKLSPVFEEVWGSDKTRVKKCSSEEEKE